LDLYCGVGTFTLPIAKESDAHVTGVEIVQTAIDSAKKNAQLNYINNIEFLCKDVNKVIDEVLVGGKYDVIAVDPPRAGLGAKVVSGLLNTDAQKIIYVSCNPSTLARDLEGLSLKYSIKNIQPFDLFPQTYHTENVVILESAA
jgi:23S rRNA (uracil1939-C5)-methyltransferase